MKCELVYCLYHSEEKCTLSEDDMEIDAIGSCGSMIIMRLDEDFLNKERKRQLDCMYSDD